MELKQFSLANKHFLYFLSLLLLCSCATYKAQYGSNAQSIAVDLDSNEISHELFLIGDAGNVDEPKAKETLELLDNQLQHSNKNATLVFLGDNIYPKGMPLKKQTPERETAEEKLLTQISIAEKFKGKTVFISGNHDWMYGVESLEEQAQMVREKLKDKKAFLPQNNCGIERLKINDDVAMIVIDSQWFLEDWNKNPNINNDCSITSREAFFDEVKSLLNKNQDKIVLVAIHHPVISNSSHGGQVNSWYKQLYPIHHVPLPVIGSVLNFIRPVIGIPQDILSKPYFELSSRLKTLAQQYNNVVFISGHEHNLQYVAHEGIKQIISGAGSKTDQARAIGPEDFSIGELGFAKLTVYKDQTTKVDYFINEQGAAKHVFSKVIIEPAKADTITYPKQFPTTISTSIYPKSATQKSRFYRFLFGDHYRDSYAVAVKVPVVNLDTLYGGLEALRAGGGMQSNSLRLVDKQGKEFAMRSLKKNSVRFIQSSLYNNQYVSEEYQNAGASNFLNDFFTASNQYYSFIVGHLAQTIGVYHTNPKLYYIPKQAALGRFNSEYGDELYMIEDRPMSAHSSSENFGQADDIISTIDLLENLQKNEKSSVDEAAFIRARLFDMLLGDWDRHQDQWRWSEYQDGKNKMYRPIPRDRDQAFGKYDGVLIRLLLNIPAVRHIQHFDYTISDKKLKWLNKSANPLDLAFIRNAYEQDWIQQAKIIQSELTDAKIQEAFSHLPAELQDESREEVMAKLRSRRDQLHHWAQQHYKNLQKRVVLIGTDKEERFEITRLGEHQTQIKIYRIKKEGEELIFDHTYTKELTKEIWIYGLDDTDTYVVNGKQKNPILLRLIGGENHDTYTIEEGKAVRIYDYKSKKNTYDLHSSTRLIKTDNYDINSYDYKRPKYNIPFIMPYGGYNPDDGIWIGPRFTYQINGFIQDPFTAKHSITTLYAFANHGVNLQYEGIFANVFGLWDFHLNANYISPSFSTNYFGFGNETSNWDQDLGMNFNRIRMQKLSLAPSLVYDGHYGSQITAKVQFDHIKVEDTTDRIAHMDPNINPQLFDGKLFTEASVGYTYKNYDHKAYPTMGFTFNLEGKWTLNLEDTAQNFPTITSHLGFTRKITRSGNLTFATLFQVKAVLDNEFEFFQGATLGASSGLRGYRNERFLGKTSYVQSSDLRLLLGQYNKGFVPIKFGLTTGFDYGRVWLKEQTSNQWHTSYGGGLWLSLAELLSVNANLFRSSEGNQFTFGIGFNY